MNEKTSWETAAEAEGTTESERVLTRLAKKAFLSLWSYANVFTDEGRGKGTGDGKELCDLLVVFGNDVILFSDKDCEYQSNKDVKIAWPRWYTRAIEKSAKQLEGAEKFAKAFPNRIYIDRKCQVPLPVAMPNATDARFFLVAVTRGAHSAAQVFFGGGSSGSLVLDNSVQGVEHYSTPFRVGRPLRSGRFVHVLDETTVAQLLGELDTVPDLVSYLACKEAFLSTPGVIVSAPGEEDVLARYMMTFRDGRHALPEIPADVDAFVLPEGDWAAYLASPERAAKREADAPSYLWDSLIEHQSKFIRAGTAITFSGESPERVQHERILRALAQQDRLTRRKCGADLHYVLSRDEPKGVFARLHMKGSPPERVFVFLAVKRPIGMDYAEYRESRMQYLVTYCHAVKADTPSLTEAIGISAEPFSEREASFEFLYVDHSRPMTKDEALAWRAMADELEILRPSTQVLLAKEPAREFLMPFMFETQQSQSLGRAERRKAERAARKSSKKGPRK